MSVYRCIPRSPATNEIGKKSDKTKNRWLNATHGLDLLNPHFRICSGSTQFSLSHRVWICSIFTYASEMDQLNPHLAHLIKDLLHLHFHIWPGSAQSELSHLAWICSVLT